MVFRWRFVFWCTIDISYRSCDIPKCRTSRCRRIVPKASIYRNSELRYIEKSCGKFRCIEISNFDISEYRAFFALHPVVSSCFICRYWAKASMYQISNSYRLVFLLIGIVSNSIPISVSYRTRFRYRYRIELDSDIGILSNSILISVSCRYLKLII